MTESRNVIEILLRARDEATKALDKTKGRLETLNQKGHKANKVLKTYDKQLAVVDKANKRLERVMQGVNQQFDGAALSIMFFGMALTNVFSQIKNFGVKTFQDVMHSVEGTVTGFDRLNASTDILKFSVGAALEPIVGFLIPIIQKITDWVEAHEGLVRTITITLGTTGAVMTAFGIIKLGIAGLITKWHEAMGVIKNPAAFTTFKTNALTALNIVKNAAIIYFAFDAASDAYDAFKKENIGEGIGKVLKGATWLAAFSTKNPWLFAIGVAMELVDRDAFFTSIFSIAGVIAALFDTLGQTITHMINFVLSNAIVKVLEMAEKGLSKIGVEVDLISDELQALADKDFSFVDTFTEDMAVAISMGKKLDTSLTNIMKDAEAMVGTAPPAPELLQEQIPQILQQQAPNTTTINIYGATERDILNAFGSEGFLTGQEYSARLS